MKITEVTYGRTFSNGNYEFTRIDFTAQVDADEDPEEVFDDLVDMVYAARKQDTLMRKGE